MSNQKNTQKYSSLLNSAQRDNKFTRKNYAEIFQSQISKFNVLNKKIERVYKKYASLDLDVQDKDQIENIIKSMPIKSVDKFNKLVDQMQCDIEKVCNSTGKSIQKNSKTSKILENKNIIRNLIR